MPQDKNLKRPLWGNTYKQDWDEAYERIMAWWHNEETDRPLFLNAIPKPVSQRKITPITPKDAEEARRFDLDPEVQLHNAKAYLENNLFPAEAVPRTMSNFASLLGLLCVQCGGKIQYAPGNFTAWLEEEPQLYERSMPDTSRTCKELNFILDMIKRNNETFGYDAVLGANPMLDPLTTLSMMRGTDNFCMDLIDRPGDVKRGAAGLGTLHRQAISAFRDTRSACGRREDCNWSGAWAPGDMDAIQCDVSALLSPEMFREFALPEAEYEASFYDYTIWHLDGTAEFKHVDDICAIPNLHAIQYIDEKLRDPMEFVSVWEKILKHGKSILFSCEAKYAPALTKHLGRRGLAFCFLRMNSEAELEQVQKEIKQGAKK
jgi:SAM-dependent methyltransferase